MYGRHNITNVLGVGCPVFLLSYTYINDGELESELEQNNKCKHVSAKHACATAVALFAEQG